MGSRALVCLLDKLLAFKQLLLQRLLASELLAGCGEGLPKVLFPGLLLIVRAVGSRVRRGTSASLLVGGFGRGPCHGVYSRLRGGTSTSPLVTQSHGGFA